jgi:MFS family permease
VNGDWLATPGRRRALLTLLYVTEGAPIGYLWTALPARLRAGGIAVDEITTLGALITVPWSLKFLWAPLVDAFRSRSRGVRPWIAGAQIAMALTLLPLAFLDPVAHFEMLLPLLCMHAFCASTQDVAIDALAIQSLSPDERGSATGWMQLGMLIGQAVFGGGALAAAVWIGEGRVVWLMVVAVASSAIWVMGRAAQIQPTDTLPAGRVGERLRHVGRRLATVLRGRATWLGLAFASVAGAGMEGIGALATPLLIDRGLPPADVGWYFGMPKVAAMGAGLLFGGWLADRVPRRRAAGFGIGLLFLWSLLLAGAVDGDPRTLLLLLAGAQILFGVVTAASYSLLMDMTDPDLGASQFSAYMGAINLCYVWAAYTAGELTARFGYAPAMTALAGASLVSLLLLPALGRPAIGVAGK